jgi:DNA mismatch repair protein MSH4
MHLHYPTLILIPDTFLSSKDNIGPSSKNTLTSTSLLVQCLYDEFPGVPVEPVLRKYWNEDAGMSPLYASKQFPYLVSQGLEFVSQLCVRDEERTATILAVSRKCAYMRPTPLFLHILNPPVARYYALSAASALFKYVEIKLSTRFSNGSLRIRFVPVEGTMMIDPETVRNLEIIDNMGNARSPHSLFGYDFLSPAEKHSFSSFLPVFSITALPPWLGDFCVGLCWHPSQVRLTINSKPLSLTSCQLEPRSKHDWML